MKFRTTVAVGVAAITVAATAWPASAAPPPLADASVIGGRPASIAEFPSLAYITGGSRPSSFSCTGTVVAPRVVLTAGRCVDNTGSLAEWKVSNYAIVTGIANVFHPSRSNISSATRAITYPGFNPSTLTGDAGLLILSRPVVVPAIPLASISTPGPLAPETPLTIAGWGVTDPNPFESHTVLQAGEVRVQAPRICEKVDFFRSPALQLCGVDKPGQEMTTCYGDSGGPVIARAQDGTPVEVGIVSSDSECLGGLPSVYTRVDNISEWVHSWINATESGAAEPTLPRAHLPVLRKGDVFQILLWSSIEAVVSHLDSGGAVAPHPNGSRRAAGASRDNSCKRLSRAKFRCIENTRYGRERVFRRFTIFYAIEHNAVVLNGHYLIRRVTCFPRTATPRHCTRHIERG